MLSPIEDIVDEARNGRIFVLVDDEDRENEGDLVIPGQMATPEAINFMAKHGRGLICLALTRQRVEQLSLDLMASQNGSRHQTAFTVSIEAREGVTTGISAQDRARTIAVAIDSSKGASDLVTPGHVFPLMARDGGVLVRAGHTEAAVDICRLAGLNASGVICEIMREDGTMARMQDLAPFARKHNLKIGTIRDLIAYRMRHDHLVERVSDNAFTSEHGGRWRVMTYRNRVDGAANLVLQKGELPDAGPTLVRMHRISVFDDVLGQLGERGRPLQRAMDMVGHEGCGVIVILRSKDDDELAREMQGVDVPPRMDLRNYGIGAQILADLGVNEMTLITSHHRNVVALEGYGLRVVGERPLA